MKVITFFGCLGLIISTMCATVIMFCTSEFLRPLHGMQTAFYLSFGMELIVILGFGIFSYQRGIVEGQRRGPAFPYLPRSVIERTVKQKPFIKYLRRKHSRFWSS